MGRGTNTIIAIAVMFVVIILMALFFGLFAPITGGPGNPNIFNSLTLNSTSSVPNNQATTTAQSTAQTQLNYSYLVNYTLELINQDRAAFGAAPVSLSQEPSGQQHAGSMLQYNYFSHWDIYGMKPYMRYTALGGTESVDENIATLSSRECSYIGHAIAGQSACTGALNVTKSISNMEYSMMYNDSACCNNGHRENILDPNHNQVRIGIAYNSSTIYLVEDFIDSYVSWFQKSPGYSNGEVTLAGRITPGKPISTILVAYDPPVSNMSRSTLDGTGPYGYGTNIAGVAKGRLEYYPDLQTIYADSYQVNGNQFYISFNISSLVSQYGAGEYTMGLWLNGSSSSGGGSFVAATYTVFINSDKQQYQPQGI
ncbi:MAG: CAP domain-containing protein [Candidatus Micrarchaeota archaeon]|nr:CAP domain-containing protein [Candidatus Micrarchaeota archaeon]